MAEKLNREQVAEMAIIHAEPPALRAPHEVDRNFGLPTPLYVLTACGYLGFLGVMALAVGNPGLAIPMAIFVTFIVMAFGVCAQWVRMKPDNPTRALSWDRFQRDGIMTASGRLGASQAMIQVLILPVLILCWGIIGATIIALS
jgi:hypothetical protein